jgi:hypothetical protein
MRHETVTIPAPTGLDWKGIGYLFSIAGALLLGAIAWPKPDDPWWHLPALIGGVATTIAGFVIRYIAHLREKRELRKAKAEADRR